MGRKSPASVEIQKNLRAIRIYPTEEQTKKLSKLKTVGIRLNKAQALSLARVLLLVTQDWDEVDITAYRFKRRKNDDTYPLTVTSIS